MKNYLVLFAMLFMIAPLTLSAQLKLARIFSDHMVLQRNQPITVWGNAAPNDRVVVYLNGEVATVKASRNGTWKATLPAMKEGGPYTLAVRTRKEQRTFEDVLIGDVWLASGQSNMEWPLQLTNDAEAEIAAAHYPFIRQIIIQKSTSLAPLNELEFEAAWKETTPQNAPAFSAVGYFFARELFKQTGVPIGIINSSWGGTMVETWISRDKFNSMPDFRQLMAKLPVDAVAYKKAENLKLQQMLEKFQGTGKNETAENWQRADYDDSNWKTLQVPGLWESQGLDGLDGQLWYRMSIDLTPDEAAKANFVNLGLIDDCDVTYINGHQIGETCKYDALRRYPLPPGILKAGKNVIAVKVTDTGGGGGMYGDASGFSLEAGGQPLSLAGAWKARFAAHSIMGNLNPNAMPTLLYNAMIHPLLNVGLAGTIWYQGESNAGRAMQYNESFKTMIEDWRSKFNRPNLPFYFVQLASFNANNQNGLTGSAWAELREAQFNTLNMKNTGMAVTADIGDVSDIHPRNKKDVGKRLALWALHDIYGKADLVYSGPLYKGMRIEGNNMIISFNHTGSGLIAKDKYGYLRGFMIAGEDQQFHWAKAEIRGNEVAVWNDKVSRPMSVRYGWTDSLEEANLYNAEGLPASPFRTDNWKALTQDNKYNF